MTTEIIEGEVEEQIDEQPVEEMGLVEEIKQALSQKNVVLGSKLTLKELKNGNLSKVVLANNVPQNTREEIKHYAELSNTQVEEFPGNSSELGAECMRAHIVLMIGIKKSETDGNQT